MKDALRSSLLAAVLLALPPIAPAADPVVAPPLESAAAAPPSGSASPAFDGYALIASMTGSMGGWMIAGTVADVALMPFVPVGLSQTVLRLSTQVAGSMLGSSYARHLYADALIP